MKLKILTFLAFVAISAGSCEPVTECFQESGEMTSKVITAEDFTMINVGEGIEVVVKMGEVRSVVVHSGQNLIDDITATVVSGELMLRNGNTCNWSRTYNNTTVVVTSPELSKIYSASQFAVRSEGSLSFPSLSLQSAMFDKTASGTFKLNVHCHNLTVEDNASAYFEITGQTTDLTVNFYDGNARFEGSGIAAENVYVFQRSSNDIIVAPHQSVSGRIFSTGNVVLKSVPPIVDVVQLYTGHLVYP